MNKTMEYMAFELPVVAFDLRETRVSAADAAVYVTPNDVREYAKAIVALMDDEARRTQMGKRGRVRVEQELAWPHQRARLRERLPAAHQSDRRLTCAVSRGVTSRPTATSWSTS